MFNQTNKKSAYLLSLFAGAFIGRCDEWVKRGMQETPEQIVDMLKKFEKDNGIAKPSQL
ncbi:MAG: hypothetical protein HFE31_05705 [Clostridia bacterium]|nr:hypothetical protein [Clostridia bacterium]